MSDDPPFAEQDDRPFAAAQDAATTASPGANARDSVVRDIVRGLYEGRYEPGQRLQEAKLTQAYGLSRGPIREALSTLAARGVVVMRAQRGAHIGVVRLGEAIDTLVVAQNLIGLSARLAAQNIEADGARTRVTAAIAELGRHDPASKAAEFAIARDTFYGTLTSLSGNQELRRLLPLVRVHLIRVQFRSMLRATDPDRHDDYRRIAEAVLAGRTNEAEAAARVHLGRAIKTLQALADPKT